MGNLNNILISVSMLCGVISSAALAVEITIDPAAFSGDWMVDYGPVQRGPAVINLGEPDPVRGAHVISISGAELMFNADANGLVTPNNPKSAYGEKYRLVFNTVQITVDPVFFSGKWRVSQGATKNMFGVQTVALVPGLKFYSMKVGSTGGFDFHINDEGTVIVRNELAAKGGPGSLKLNNTEKFQKIKRPEPVDLLTE